MASPFLVPGAIAIASEFFPVLATKMGGRRGRDVAQRVVNVSARIAGTPKNASPREIITALREDDTKRAELRLQLEQLDEEEYARSVEDRMDARRHQASQGWRSRLRGTLMLIGVVIGLVICISVVAFGDINATQNAGALALLTTIAGALLKMLSDAFAFEFGSSLGSKEKSHHIGQIQSALVETARDRGRRHRHDDAAPQRPLDPPLPMPGPEIPDLVPPNARSAATAADGLPSASHGQAASLATRDFVAELVSLST